MTLTPNHRMQRTALRAAAELDVGRNLTKGRSPNLVLTYKSNVITMWALILLARSAMRARIIKIGNSQGIRLPKPVIEQAGISNDVDIAVESEKIIIRPISKPRADGMMHFKKSPKIVTIC